MLAGSRPGRRGTLVSAYVPKVICACAIARKSQRVSCTPRRLRGPGQGTIFAPTVRALLERPVRTVRGAPARRGGDSLDPRLLSGSPLSLRRTPESSSWARAAAGCAAADPGGVSLGTFLSRQESTSPSGARTRFEYSPVRRHQLLRWMASDARDRRYSSTRHAPG